MFWIPMAIGAAMGALSDSKNPLRGAMIGGTLGAFTGGLGGAAAGGAGGASGGLLGGAAGGSAAGAGSGILGGAASSGYGLASAAPSLGFNASGFLGGASTLGGIGSSGLGYAAPAIGAGSGFGSGAAGASGLLSGLNTAMDYAKPIGKAMETANMFQPNEKMPDMPLVSPVIQEGPKTGPQGLSQLVGQNQQMAYQQQMEDARKRAEQKARIARIGGYA